MTRAPILPLSIETGSSVHLIPWLALRKLLWPATLEADHQAELAHFLAEKNRMRAFLGFTPVGECVAFAEASIRTDHVNGCSTSPVGFLEGIFVESRHRKLGYARALIEKIEDWLISQGCSEFASDASTENFLGQTMHLALGFTETERVVFFRKSLVVKS